MPCDPAEPPQQTLAWREIGHRHVELPCPLQVGADRTDETSDNYTENVGKNSATTVGEVRTLSVGKEMSVQVGDAIEIQCGKAVLRMTSDGTVQINGQTISIAGSSKVTVSSPDSHVNPA